MTTIFDTYTLRKPNLYPRATEFTEALHDSFWTDRKWTFQQDASDYRQRLTPQEQGVAGRSLAGIAQIELPVKSFWLRLGQFFPHPALADLGVAIANSEVIHGNTYEKVLEVLGLDSLFAENLKDPAFAGRERYLRKWAERAFEDDKQQVLYAVSLFSNSTENTSLFTQFYTLACIAENNHVLSELKSALLYTAIEETLHAQVGFYLVNTARSERPDLFTAEFTARILAEADEAYAAECNIVDYILQGYEAKNLNARLLKLWLHERLRKGLADSGFTWSSPLDATDREELKQTAWFENFVKASRQTDFFVNRPNEYAKGSTAFLQEDVFS